MQSGLSQLNLVGPISVVGPRLKPNIQKLAQLGKWRFLGIVQREKEPY